MTTMAISALERDAARESVLKTLERSFQRGGIINEIASRLDPGQKRRLTGLSKTLDLEFIRDKAELVQETMVEIISQREENPNYLLQRHVWASLDAIALHLDHVGFTRVFQSIAQTIFTELSLDDPRIVTFEWDLLLNVLGGERRLDQLGLTLTETQELLMHAEQEKGQACGIPRISQREYSLRAALADACGRPDEMIEQPHHSVGKVIAMAVSLAINFVAAVIGIVAAVAGFLTGLGGIFGLPAGAAGVIVAIVTLVIAMVLLACGC
jgi:hypothetical protein